jgi:hypothetical protein
VDIRTFSVGEADHVLKNYGRNAEPLTKANRRYDPDNVFCFAIPLPVSQSTMANDVVAIIKKWQIAGWDSPSQLAFRESRGIRILGLWCGRGWKEKGLVKSRGS